MTADVTAELARIRARLATRGSPEFRKSLARFFKEPIDCYGVRTPDFHKIAAEVFREVEAWNRPELNRLCRELWRGGKLEEGGMAISLYRSLARQCGRCEFRLFEQWLDRHVRNWAHCDVLSGDVIAQCIVNDPGLARELVAWTRSANRWKRRAAAVALVKEARRGGSRDLIFEVASRLVADPDEMVQKGAGWLLKDAYPASPRQVVAFLEAHPETAPLVARIAREKMTPADAARVRSAAPRSRKRAAQA